MTETKSPIAADLIEATAEIVSAYVGRNALGASDLPDLISKVHVALVDLNGVKGPAPAEPLKPAVAIKKSVTPEFLICLEDGKKFKSLKRHLATHFNLTPDEYRAKWGLSADYPMVAPNYSETRSSLAKSNGLGRKSGASKATPKVSSAAKSTPAARAKKAPAAKSSAKKGQSSKE